MTTTAIVPFGKGEVISHFSEMIQISDIAHLTDAVLFNYIRVGVRVSLEILQPFCDSFLTRFKAAKKAKQPFHGFTDFNRAAIQLTGYSGRQIRNLAAGTPTPLKKAVAKKLTPAETLYRASKKLLDEKCDLREAQQKAERELRNLESQSVLAEVSGISPSPVHLPSHKEILEVRDRAKIAAIKEASQQKDVDETNALLDLILKSIKVGTVSSVAVGNKIYSLAEKIQFHRRQS